MVFWFVLANIHWENKLNNCIFTGYLTEDPDVQKHDGVSNLRFEMVVYQYRKTKSGEKSRTSTYVEFEAWDSGAETIAKLAKKGSKMTIASSARNNKEDGFIIFRVNEFDFANIEEAYD